MNSNLADPIFAQVNLNSCLGYEYEDANGSAQGPFPAIAIFTWGLKGYLPRDFKLRRAGRVEYHKLSELEREILLVSRVQLSNLLLTGKEWFYIDNSGKIQGPFSAEKMTDYIGTRYMTESVSFFGRKPGADQNKSALNKNQFQSFGELLDESVARYRQLMNVSIVS
eukprot:g8670.t2